MRIERPRANVFVVTAAGAELFALAAAARMTLGLLRSDPDTPPTAIATLTGVLADYDSAVARLADGDPSIPPRPPRRTRAKETSCT